MALENVKVVLGDIFDTSADAIVIPRSTSGTIGSVFERGLLDVFKYEVPEIMPFKELGGVDFMSLKNGERKNNHNPENFIFFASCVDGFSSSYVAIERIMKDIFSFCEKNPKIRDVAMPLIGTGAGNLLASSVYEIIQRVFGKLDSKISLTVYIFEESKYRQVINAMNANDGNRVDGGGYDDLNIFLEYLGKKYVYLLEIELDKKNEYSEYFKKGVWINNSGKNKTNFKEMEVGSPFFLKNYEQATNGEHGIRLHAAGIINGNKGDGITLEVNWILEDMDLFVLTDHPYDKNVGRVGEMNGKKILDAIGNWEVFKQNLLNRKPENQVRELSFAISAIADINNDEDRGHDYLDIKKDYTAFAKIIASKDFVPPLSIALFGKWGTGKSFFMKKLDEEVGVYSVKGSADFYCRGIAQIHFNAWSYMDANLWASIVSKVFEGLYSYIAQDNHTKEEVRLISESLSKKMVTTSEELSVIEKEKTSTQTEIAKFEVERNNLEEGLKKKIDQIKGDLLKNTVEEVDKQFDVTDKLKSVIMEDDSVQLDLEKIKQVVPEKYLGNPAEAYERAKSAVTFAREFFRKEKIVGNLIVISLIMLAIIFMPVLVGWASDVFRIHILPQIQALLFLVTLLIPVWKRLKSTFDKISPIVSVFWKVKEMYRLEIDSAKVKAAQQEKLLKLEIEFAEGKVKSLDLKIQAEKEILRELTFKMEHAIATQTLYSFVEKRCNSDEYQKHLGIVSIIRKDFEVLSNLFVDHKKEVVDADALKFRKLFKRPLERIVLYIDDLDRCPEERVVEVLEAVNLLMAFPLFVVVVGVDPRWVRKALAVKYKSQFSNIENVKNDGDEISASDYLEKIFQIPFHLKQASDDAVKVMLRSLLKPHTKTDPTVSQEEVDGFEKEDEYVEEGDVNEGYIENQSSNEKSSDKGIIEEEWGENLKLSQKEIESIQHISGILGNNPRGIKRFVNIYKIVRAHEGLSYMSDDQEKEFLVVMMLLALYNGRFKKLGSRLTDFLDNPLYAEETLVKFLDFSSEDEYTPMILEIRTVLEKTPIGDVLFHESVKTFAKQNEFIRRFTFYDE